MRVCSNRLATGFALFLIGACVQQGVPFQPDDPKPPANFDPELLTGRLMFGEPVAGDEVGDVDALGLDDTMRAFVDVDAMSGLSAAKRLQWLIKRLEEEGHFADSYNPLATLTARETFRSKDGNCLSYTTLFIALARASGLHAYYQMVTLPPNWSADSGLLIRNNHVNAVVYERHLVEGFTREYIVDFNALEIGSDLERHRVSDNYATTLYYSNLAVEHMRHDRSREAFALLRKGIELVPGNADLWVNLAAFYARNDKLEAAVSAYEVVLQLDPTSKTALSGLSSIYAAMGDAVRAERYARQVREYRERNPFYHFALAQLKFENANYAASLAAVNRAIELKRRNPSFYQLKGQAEQKLGDAAAAARSFSRARRYERLAGLTPTHQPRRALR